MKHQIITQAADMAAVLRFLKGHYALPTSYRVNYSAGALLLLALAIFLGVKLFTWTPQSGDDRSALVILLAFALGLAGFFANRGMTSYSFSERTIERHSPLPFTRKTLAVDHVHEGWVHVGDSLALELIASDGSKLTIPLEARLREDFLKLYPELGTDADWSAPVLPSRFRAAIWIAVAVLVIAVVIFAIVLARKGLITW